MDDAKNAIDVGNLWWTWIPFATLRRKNYKIFWELVHRTDEDIILLVPEAELLSKAVDVKTSFDLNIKDEALRIEWLGNEGEKGELLMAIDRISKVSQTEAVISQKGLLNGTKEIEESRYIIKEAMKIINERMDHSFWILSLNNLVGVLSSFLLAFWMFIFYFLCYPTQLVGLAVFPFKEIVIPVSILGLIGAYVSNIITREDFLFIKGPFWRYMVHHIISKPILAAFAAVFICVLEKSKLIFSITPVTESGETMTTGIQQIISINVPADYAGYVYAILAIASGFSADKLMRGMIDRVLKRLEENAEKTKETPNGE
ncbi:MAG: hypothetical protein HZA08_10200 [Nitrospirae bacterium]|nr:hypothetical protein [Nitrospirota bacterium]